MNLISTHEQLFDQYVAELSEMAEIAKTQFDQKVAFETNRGLSEEDAHAAVRIQQGPVAAHPCVLAIIRKYFFACDKLNREIEERGEEEFTYPNDFVHDMLAGSHEELWEFIADLDYLPIGVSRDEEWI